MPRLGAHGLAPILAGLAFVVLCAGVIVWTLVAG